MSHDSSSPGHQASPTRFVWDGSPGHKLATGSNVQPQPHDARVERLRSMPTWQIAYCRDMVRVLAPDAPRLRGGLSDDTPSMVGRAYTVSGPDIYLDALEGMEPGSVYVHADCHAVDAVMSPGWTHAYARPRGCVGIVVDGGLYKAREAAGAACPIFSRFISPSPAINRACAPRIGGTVSIGGVSIAAGDIVVGDADGLLIVPRHCEDELFAGIDAFVEANGAFGKIAAVALEKGVALTQEPALAAMFQRKYSKPEAYWSEYAPWWREWKANPKYAAIVQSSSGTAAFYSGSCNGSTNKASDKKKRKAAEMEGSECAKAQMNEQKK